MMTHYRFRDLLSEFSDGTLSATLRQEFESHREACPDCDALAASFLLTLQELRAFPELEVPQGFTARVLALTTHRTRPLGFWESLWLWLRFPRLTPVATLSLLALPLLLVAGTKQGREVAREVNMATHQTYSRAVRLVRQGEGLRETAWAVGRQIPDRLEETVGWFKERFRGSSTPDAGDGPAPENSQTEEGEDRQSSQFVTTELRV